MKALAIVNKNAGSVETISDFERQVSSISGIEIVITETTNDARAAVRRAGQDGFETIVAAGGDGTVNTLINAARDDLERLRFGLLPLGTGNDLARTLGIPPGLEDALECLQRGRTRKLDLGCAEWEETRLFINMSACGFSGTVDEEAGEEVKRAWGPLSYVVSAARALPELEEYEAIIDIDDERMSERVLNVLVANGRFLGGGIPGAPRAEPDDGLFDVVVVPVVPLGQLAVLASRVLAGTHPESEQIIYRRSRRVTLRTGPPMPFNLDGELVDAAPVSYEIWPGAVEFIVGPDAAE